MNIVDILRAQAAARPGALALAEGRPGRGRALTFAGLERDSARAAALLGAHGLRPGDAVLVLQPMSVELYVALIAIFRLGLVAVFLEPCTGRARIERCCEAARPRALIASSRAHLLRVVSPALRRIERTFAIGWPVPGATPWGSAARMQPDDRVRRRALQAPALLTFTSGSTGEPKAAVRTHGFLLAQHRALRRALPAEPGAVDLTTLPILVLSNLGSGVTSVLPDADLRHPGAIDPAPVIAQIREHRVVSTAASPALLERLTRYARARKVTLPTLRRVVAGGAPVPPRLLAELEQVAPNAEILALYGSTEAEPIARLRGHELWPAAIQAVADGCGLPAGRPVEDVRVRILPDRWGTPIGPFTEAELDALSCPPGVAGEIVVSGEHVLSGYWLGRGDGETKFRVGQAVWHRTGDAGYLDGEGRLWLLGRSAARIDDSRGRLYPFAVECVLAQDPRVRRAAVALHDGRRVVAVELNAPGRASDLGELADAVAWACIDEIREYRSLPVDQRHEAKIDYGALHALLARGHPRRRVALGGAGRTAQAEMRGVSCP